MHYNVLSLTCLSLLFLLALPSSANTPPKCPTNGGGLRTDTGRLIAIVIDSSSSNLDTDPDNLRITAGKQLSNALISKSDAASNSDAKPDLVTIVDFDSSASVVYPLGDPDSADFSTVDSDGGTYIAEGIRVALEELEKGVQSESASGKRAGIVVLTDGQDGSTSRLIAELGKAASRNIRVSFGFLNPDSLGAIAPPKDLIDAIIATGGIYSSIGNAAAQQAFVNLVVQHGLTDEDGAAGSSRNLFAGLTTSAKITRGTGPLVFHYASHAGEKLIFTVESLTEDLALKATLVDASDKNNILESLEIDEGAEGSIDYEVKEDGVVYDLTITGVSSNSSFAGLVNVGVNSSDPIICIVPGGNGTILGGNGTVPGGNVTTPGGNGTIGGGNGPTPTPREPVFDNSATRFGSKFGLPSVAALLFGVFALL